jgi:hypothetical protein
MREQLRRGMAWRFIPRCPSARLPSNSADAAARESSVPANRLVGSVRFIREADGMSGPMRTAVLCSPQRVTASQPQSAARRIFPAVSGPVWG